jgi:hypothetical protein
MGLDANAEIFLWNKNVDSLIRVLQRMDALGILPRQDLNAHEVRLEELRAAVNADFTETMTMRERADQSRLKEQRVAWEQQESHEKAKRTENRECAVGIQCIRRRPTLYTLSVYAASRNKETNG